MLVKPQREARRVLRLSRQNIHAHCWCVSTVKNDVPYIWALSFLYPVLLYFWQNSIETSQCISITCHSSFTQWKCLIGQDRYSYTIYIILQWCLTFARDWNHFCGKTKTGQEFSTNDLFCLWFPEWNIWRAIDVTVYFINYGASQGLTLAWRRFMSSHVLPLSLKYLNKIHDEFNCKQKGFWILFNLAVTLEIVFFQVRSSLKVFYTLLEINTITSLQKWYSTDKDQNEYYFVKYWLIMEHWLKEHSLLFIFDVQIRCWLYFVVSKYKPLSMMKPLKYWTTLHLKSAVPFEITVNIV